MDQQEEKNNGKNNKRNICLILYQNINCAYTVQIHERNLLFVRKNRFPTKIGNRF